MKYFERKKIKTRIKQDIEAIKEYDSVEGFVDTHLQMSWGFGGYNDNSLDLSYKYKMLKEIEADSRFADKLNFVLREYAKTNCKKKLNEAMKEKIKYSTIVAITVIALMYMFFAFVLAEWNPFVWSEVQRFLLIFFGIGLSVIAVVEVLDNYKEE